jgi:hypothetical protein
VPACCSEVFSAFWTWISDFGRTTPPPSKSTTTTGDRTRRGVILQELLRRVNALPGIEAAGVADMLPLDRNRSWGLAAKGIVASKEKNYDAFLNIVTPGYLNAMGMHPREGHDFSGQDTSKSEPVIIINEAAARREWPGENPVGRLAQGIGSGDTRVVGVIADVRESSLEDRSSPEVYVPTIQAEPEGSGVSRAHQTSAGCSGFQRDEHAAFIQSRPARH